MRKIISMACVAAVFLGTALASTALTSSRQAGVRVSDAEASSIKGGCSGMGSCTCDEGTCVGNLVQGQTCSENMVLTQGQVKNCVGSDSTCGTYNIGVNCNY